MLWLPKSKLKDFGLIEFYFPFIDFFYEFFLLFSEFLALNVYFIEVVSWKLGFFNQGGMNNLSGVNIEVNESPML